MMTVNEISKITGVSVRTLHYYDEIGLLAPTVTTEAVYRMYDDTSLERLGQILLFKELEFPLKDIKSIIDSPNFDRKKALSEQIGILTLKKERLENLISFAEKIKSTGGCKMNFKVFNKQKLEDYKAEAKKLWGNTDAYREYDEKAADYSDEKQNILAAEMMGIFEEFGKMLDKVPADEEVQKQVKKLQDFISANYYTCTNQILTGLGQMYSSGGEMSENIDRAGGKGTAIFVSKAITEYCK